MRWKCGGSKWWTFLYAHMCAAISAGQVNAVLVGGVPVSGYESMVHRMGVWHYTHETAAAVLAFCRKVLRPNESSLCSCSICTILCLRSTYHPREP